ncbi:MAG: hydrolase TatD [Planctomycetia bacterium 21-64-5]|nr:MAG: hydrolase TatD [Planctomycetia bacterium 21-64-5]HQU46481.1 TatD family hydrolase [Pirellulales bacterium]
MHLFDTHAHLDQPEFDADRAEVIDRARQAGVETILAVGITADSSLACVELAAKHSGILAAVGIQPNYCGQAASSDWERVLSLVERPGVVALGETGLDRYWDYSEFEVQQDYFDRHLRLSQERGLPFIVHTRESDADVLAMLRDARRRGPLAGVMHSFTGSAETAAECVELGLSISFAGMVTFKKADDLRAVARSVPNDRILIETDSPYLSPHPLRGRRNEPAHLVHTAACLAAARGITAEAFAAQTAENARRLFGISAPQAP